MKKKIVKIGMLLLLSFSLLFAVSACETKPSQQESFTLTYIAMEGGHIEGKTKQIIVKGQDGNEVTAVPDEGYDFRYWIGGEISQQMTLKNTCTNVQEDTVITAVFEKRRVNFNYIADEGGTIDGRGGQQVPYGEDTQSVTAVPREGYDFDGWSDGVETATRQDFDVKQETNVTAKFKKQSRQINYLSGKGGKIEGELSQTVLYGDQGTTVTALPDRGYKFVKWSDNGNTNPIRTDIIKNNISTTAEFGYLLPDGSGTIEKPIIISTYADFLDVAQYPDLHYKLNADLDLSGISHKPLFDGANTFDEMFNGIFDGNGHTIRNMMVDTVVSNPSLFGYVNLGVIKNLYITDFDITVQNVNTAYGVQCVGAAAAGSWGELNNVHTKGIIRGNEFTFDGVAIGGLVGQAGGKVTNCSADVAIDLSNITSSNTTGTPFNVGGLVGVGFADISDCVTRGTIKVNQSHSEVYIGGLVGCFIVNREEVYYVKDCTTNIKITNGNGSIVNEDGLITTRESYAKCGGLIGNAQVIGKFTIEYCEVYGDIYGGGHTGGFISYITGYGASKIYINNCYVKNDITISGGAGFIFQIRNDSDSGGILKITNCYSKGNIKANMTAGFCYMVGKNVEIYRCYSARDIHSQAMTAGFVFQMMGGSIEECFSTGEVTISFQGSAFLFVVDKATVKNCYSSSNVTVTNTDPDAEMRTFASGIVVLASKGINIINFYYSGKISGNVHTTSQVSGLGSIVGDFAGTIGNSKITNCHMLYYEDTFTMDIIVKNYNPISPTDLTVYNDKSEMSSLADKLNEGLDEPVWVMGANGLPQLKFVAKS